jgi:hypothetical protein
MGTICWFDRYVGAIFNLLLGLLFGVAGVGGFFLFPATALATETQWQWQGEQGYQVQINLTYPDTVTTGIAAIEGRGKPQNLQDLTVQVYDPSGKKLAVYDNVIAGQSGQDDFLQLHFDVAQHQLQGWLDIGGVKPGEYFLKGQPGTSLDLFYLDIQGKETKVDHIPWLKPEDF